MSSTGFSQRDIEEGKQYMKMKEFWQVYNDYDNCNLLQAILDEYYNECPNTYSAEILEHQNSSRIIVKCNVCSNTELSSYDPFISHNNGKNHKKNLVERKDFSNNATADLPLVVFKRIEDIENPFERDTLESDLFETTYDIIGYQFLYREIKDKKELITCQLCARGKKQYHRMKRSLALKHMQSESHKDNYLRVKFDIENSALDDEHFRSSFIKKVVRREGKLMQKILTIDESDPVEEPRSSKKSTKSDVQSEDLSSSKDQIIKDPKIPETPEQFLDVIHGHMQYLLKNQADNVIKKLEEDQEATDLLIATANVLAQKIYLFSENYDSEFKEHARKLLEKCEKLKLPSLD